jgi:hypothetical protein
MLTRKDTFRLSFHFVLAYGTPVSIYLMPGDLQTGGYYIFGDTLPHVNRFSQRRITMRAGCQHNLFFFVYFVNLTMIGGVSIPCTRLFRPRFLILGLYPGWRFLRIGTGDKLFDDGFKLSYSFL